MKNVCVITGGGSGMGLDASKCIPKDKIIVLTGRTLSKLDKAVKELNELGFEALLPLISCPQDGHLISKDFSISPQDGHLIILPANSF